MDRSVSDSAASAAQVGAQRRAAGQESRKVRNPPSEEKNRDKPPASVHDSVRTPQSVARLGTTGLMIHQPATLTKLKNA